MREGADIPPCKFNFGVVCANGGLKFGKPMRMHKQWTIFSNDIIYYGMREAYYVGDPNQYCIVYTILDANPDVRNAADDLNDAGKIPISVRICINAKNGDILEIYQNDACWDFPDRLGI